MKHKYCLDTSGFSNPLMEMPEDIHINLWKNVESKVYQEIFCWNVEIDKEIALIKGSIGRTLISCRNTCLFEVGKGNWNWKAYLEEYKMWCKTYRDYISEFNHDRKDTISLNDLSIVCFAKNLNLPIFSMEKPNLGQRSTKKIRIPELCSTVNVQHYNFIQICRKEGITDQDIAYVQENLI